MSFHSYHGSNVSLNMEEPAWPQLQRNEQGKFEYVLFTVFNK